jgi:tRNA pseudouridine-54 N-methylase
MHDPVILRKPTGTKDDQGFADMVDIPVIGRVTEESVYVMDSRGETVQASHIVILPNTVTPVIGDEIQIGSKTVKIIKAIARKNFSGKKIFFWVTTCGT